MKKEAKTSPKNPEKKRRVPPGDAKADAAIKRGEHFSEDESRTAETRRLHGERMNQGEEDIRDHNDTNEIVSPDNAFRETGDDNSTLEP